MDFLDELAKMLKESDDEYIDIDDEVLEFTFGEIDRLYIGESSDRPNPQRDS